MLGVEMRPCFEMPGRDDEMIPDDGQPQMQRNVMKYG